MSHSRTRSDLKRHFETLEIFHLRAHVQAMEATQSLETKRERLERIVATEVLKARSRRETYKPSVEKGVGSKPLPAGLAPLVCRMRNWSSRRLRRFIDEHSVSERTSRDSLWLAAAMRVLKERRGPWVTA